MCRTVLRDGLEPEAPRRGARRVRAPRDRDSARPPARLRRQLVMKLWRRIGWAIASRSDAPTRARISRSSGSCRTPNISGSRNRGVLILTAAGVAGGLATASGARPLSEDAAVRRPAARSRFLRRGNSNPRHGNGRRRPRARIPCRPRRSRGGAQDRLRPETIEPQPCRASDPIEPCRTRPRGLSAFLLRVTLSMRGE